jgi:hypothetical protein
MEQSVGHLDNLILFEPGEACGGFWKPGIEFDGLLFQELPEEGLFEVSDFGWIGDVLLFGRRLLLLLGNDHIFSEEVVKVGVYEVWELPSRPGFRISTALLHRG